jgi:adenosine 3'-phospho 5'-phosphosulfate transporter B3
VWQHNASLSRHWIVAGAMTISRGLTNVSLLYLNYPTQVVFKSLKLLTVMIGSVVWVGRRYSPPEYAATFLTVCSAALFGLGDVSASPKFEYLGIVIVLLSLVGDSLHSNSQETLLQDHKASIRETMVYSNLFSAMCCFIVCLLNGELVAALAFCRANPVVWVLIPAQALLQYLGVLCFVTSIQRFGVVLATTVTTVRKILTVLLSFFIYPKPFNQKYLFGIVLFFASFAIQYAVQSQQLQKGLGIGHRSGASSSGGAAPVATVDDDDDLLDDEAAVGGASYAGGDSKARGKYAAIGTVEDDQSAV